MIMLTSALTSNWFATDKFMINLNEVSSIEKQSGDLHAIGVRFNHGSWSHYYFTTPLECDETYQKIQDKLTGMYWVKQVKPGEIIPHSAIPNPQ